MKHEIEAIKENIAHLKHTITINAAISTTILAGVLNLYYKGTFDAIMVTGIGTALVLGVEAIRAHFKILKLIKKIQKL
tara:strand:- start:484 stop:717 length:234 start_codon:yes stop_codon:yes gene_type:complete